MRLPGGRDNRAFRCPRCKTGMPLSSAAELLPVHQLSAGLSASCPICQTDIGSDERCVTCPACDQHHHSDCWSEIGGCGSYGCAEAPELKKQEDDEPAPRAGWGDEKKCPVCSETIKAMALRCRFCHTQFDTADPLTRRDLARRSRRSADAAGLRKTAAVLFGMSLLGFLAPLTLLLSGILLLPKREELVAAGPLYAVLGFAAFGISILYSLLILFVVVL